MKKSSLESIVPIGVIALLLGIVALGAWAFFGSSSPLSRVVGEKAPYVPNFPDPQTFEGREGDKFVFQYPQKFNVTTIPIEGGGKKILVESTQARKGFELTILQFDEQERLTSERIRQDIPGIVIENEKSTSVGVEKIPALAFNSTDEYIGPTYEIWFVYQGNLYEALTYPEFASEMEEILKTWTFK